MQLRVYSIELEDLVRVVITYLLVVSILFAFLAGIEYNHVYGEFSLKTSLATLMTLMTIETNINRQLMFIFFTLFSTLTFLIYYSYALTYPLSTISTCLVVITLTIIFSQLKTTLLTLPRVLKGFYIWSYLSTILITYSFQIPIRGIAVLFSLLLLSTTLTFLAMLVYRKFALSFKLDLEKLARSILNGYNSFLKRRVERSKHTLTTLVKRLEELDKYKPAIVAYKVKPWPSTQDLKLKLVRSIYGFGKLKLLVHVERVEMHLSGSVEQAMCKVITLSKNIEEALLRYLSVNVTRAINYLHWFFEYSLMTLSIALGLLVLLALLIYALVAS